MEGPFRRARKRDRLIAYALIVLKYHIRANQELIHSRFKQRISCPVDADGDRMPGNSVNRTSKARP